MSQVFIEVSNDGGANYTRLERIQNIGPNVLVAKSYDITAYASADTMIRFRMTADGEDDEYFTFDNVQIEAELPPSAYLDTLNVKPVWDMGLQGQGVTVAVIDSGIMTETDFDDRLILRTHFNDSAVSDDDGYGHGTHVAGIIGSNGTLAFGGIAPQVNLISLKVSDETGMAYESDTVAAMEWVLENKDAYNIRVVNISLNSTMEQSYHTSPLDAAAEILWFNDVVVVTSVGNKGPAGGYNTADAAPANDPFVIAVGASDEHGTPLPADDTVAPFSAFGTTMDGFVKPDIIAPGTSIFSALSSASSWDVDFPDRVVLDEYFRLSGTSMAAPMVSGAVALLLQAEPDLSPDQVKYRLLSASDSIQGELEGMPYDYPYLNIYAALTTPTAEAANANVIPHELLAKMALIAYWASVNGDENIDWGNVDWDAVNWDAVDWNSVNWGSVNWGSVNWDSVNWDD